LSKIYYTYGKPYKEQEFSQSEVNTLGFVSKCFEDVHEILGIKVEPGTEDGILKELRKSPGVAAVYTSLGDYDIIALLTIEDSKELTEFVVDKVRHIKGILDTKTILIKK
jgi:DNA-binding Lrp family transcriptional regulator